MSNQIELTLVPMTDRYGKKYYGCFPEVPVSMRLDEITFFVFTSDEGEETIVIRKREKRKPNEETTWSHSGKPGYDPNA